MQSPSPITTTRLSAFQRLLTVLVAVVGLLVGVTSAASAAGPSRPVPSSGITIASVSETRVGVARLPAPLFVAQQSIVSPGQVGQTCPRFDGSMVGSCVATNTPQPGGGAVNKVGGTQNCTSCAIAGDSTLAGKPASAIDLYPGRPIPNGLQAMQGYAGSTWKTVSGRAAIESELLAAGNGSRGIVYGLRADGTAHVFNAAVQRGAVNFVDFQTGGAGSFSGFTHFAFLRTA